jgi:hypothetical protein
VSELWQSQPLHIVDSPSDMDAGGLSCVPYLLGRGQSNLMKGVMLKDFPKGRLSQGSRTVKLNH